MTRFSALARILIADDDPDYLDVFCEGMAALGHSAVGVADGATALARLRKDRFDMLFLDLVMAGGGAISLLHSVRALDADLPVVVITGQTDLLDTPLFRDGMRQAYAKLPKTASLGDLNSVVMSLAQP